MLLADHEILGLCHEEVKMFNLRPMISPFESKKQGAISYGLSSYGYDIRLGREFKRPILTEQTLDLLDPDTYDDRFYKKTTVNGMIGVDAVYILPPHSFVLAESYETISLRNGITGLVKDKSTYARMGISVQNTVFEAGWTGTITLEINNNTNRPVKLYVGLGIAQVMFHHSKTLATHPYSGKYQNQKGVTLAKANRPKPSECR